MADNARKTHVSPGVYSREIDLNYAVKSLGLTTLGVAGETLKGPAFQPMLIEDWARFKDTFGGTSTEKFKGTQYPKYELPYIAKSYLTESKQLEVCRVLGLSGYNAGPAWAITAKRGDKDMVIAVIRSRGYYNAYEKYEATKDDCICGLAAHDKLRYYVGELKHVPECEKITHYNPAALTIQPYVPIDAVGDECSQYNITSATSSFNVSVGNYGKFTLSGSTAVSNAWGTMPSEQLFRFSVSLNPEDNDYILKVLGTSQFDGDTPIYVESLYDVALIQGINAGEITEINAKLVFYDVAYAADLNTIPPFDDFVDKYGATFKNSNGTCSARQGSLTRRDLGKRFMYAENFCDVKPKYVKFTVENGGIKYQTETCTYNCPDGSGGTKTCTANILKMEDMAEGEIYTVRSYTNNSGKRFYVYTRPDDFDKLISDAVDYAKTEISRNAFATSATTNNIVHNNSVIAKCKKDGFYYTKGEGNVEKVTCDLNDYKSAYRFASTPWIVSNVKGDYNNIDLSRLFRFHTISDGDNANNEVKVSITNILPDEGLFNVQVRAIYDTDESPIVLESFSRCNLIPGDKNYIAFKIGSYDGVYESKSKYITVEVNETLPTRNSVPAGFLGYPLSHFNGNPMTKGMIVEVNSAASATAITDDDDKPIAPIIKYNCDYDEDIKNRKQYFGLSDLVGVDVDMFTFKGNAAYDNDPETISNGFHLDCRVNPISYEDGAVTVTVEGESGYTFDTVSINNVTDTLESFPIIGTEEEMDGTIYEYQNLRKFTVYFYGGFDGWDVYRDSRTNTDEFMYSKYEGQYNEKTGEGFAFNKIDNPDVLGLNQKGITSDWYAYLAAIRKFANPEETDINVFATPGIDYVNNLKLVEETIEMLEEERADSIYVVTTPDKPAGAGDYFDEMYSAEDAVDNLEDSEIDSNYTCTYYPWVKYFDVENNQYIFLPATKDAVRDMAQTDNVAHPWFAPAGTNRGDVECVSAKKITKIGDEDVLYDGRINPVKTFAAEGVKLWGQKNLQKNESQLNRIAVRRLLLRMRKLVAIACLGLIFEPNDATTKAKFLSTVTPILDNIRANRGISDYKIEVDDSQEARDRRELPAKIFFKPYNALEYIPIDFILTPEGVSFDEI